MANRRDILEGPRLREIDMELRRRDIYLKIEPLDSYSPLAPVLCSRHYGRDCMYNLGHEYGRVMPDEILNSTLDALVYREYFDSHYTLPNKAKLVAADVNEPSWDRRVPGCVLYAKPGERLYIHVLNGDPHDCHSFHIHGIRYGIDSDGAWPFGLATKSGRRSDEILPGQSWTYVYEVLPSMVGAWAFHDHSHNVGANISRGLFGGLIVRDPAAPCVDHEIPLFLHQLAGVSGVTFESKRLATNGLFHFKFDVAGTVHYYCEIHGPTMNGTVQIVAGAPIDKDVSIKDNFFDPPVVTVAPGGTVHWKNDGAHDHIVFSGGGGAANYCLNGRTYVGNTPTIVGDTAETLRWYLFNLDVSGVWHNFHPHSMRWEIPKPPGGASDVHSLSPLETFVLDTEVPPAMRLPCELQALQCPSEPKGCRVRIKGDFLFHCHIEDHMMAGLAGLVRARQYIWVNDEVSKAIDVLLPFDDDNCCASVDLRRCLQAHGKDSHTHDDMPGMPHLPDMPGMPTSGGGAGTAMNMSTVDVASLATKGVWELLPCHAPLLPVHGAVLHTGKVLLFAGSGNDELYTTGLRSAVWDYTNGEWTAPFTPVDFFCSGQAFMADGKLLVAGGTKEYDIPNVQGFIPLECAYAFDPLPESWIRLQSMTAGGRWYPSLTTLGDGRVFTVSGGPDHAEIYSSVTGWHQQPKQGGWPLYPHVFLMKNGHLFFSGGNVFAGAGVMSPGVLNLATNAMTNVSVPGNFDAGHRDHCASVLLAPAQAQKVMIIGGGDPAIHKVHMIDLNTSTGYTAVAPMHHARYHVNAVLLPDRTVFISGGNGQSESAPTAVLESEIYHPDTNTWTLAAKAQVARMYHSIALLLPDGRVLAAGSNPNRRDDELRLEIFHPPYLFKGPRPIISTAPTEITYGGTYALHSPNARDIKWIEIIWPMATTHSCDTGQRVVDIPFKCEDFCHLHIIIPREQNIAPPGWYMLFMVNHNGVPSEAKWVHLTGGSKPQHEPAMIKQMIDMKLTGKEKPVKGTENMDLPHVVKHANESDKPKEKKR